MNLKNRGEVSGGGRYLKVQIPVAEDGEKTTRNAWNPMDRGNNPTVLTHGLDHVLHLFSQDPVCHMSYGEGAQGFVSVHRSGLVQFYDPEGRLRDWQGITTHYAGLTSTHLKGRIVGWGPGPILSLLDAELNPLIHAEDPMDVTVCKVMEHSNELVTAGKGNICIWCLTHLVCRRQVVNGFDKEIVFIHLALLPRSTHQGFWALAAYRSAVVVVDLKEACVVEHKKNLHLREITAIVCCPLRNYVVTSSHTTIRVWNPDWELQVSFVGHIALVTSLALCPVSGLLVSSSLDGTLRCWRPDVGDQVLIISIPKDCPVPLVLGGPNTAGMFFSYSSESVDFWTFNCLYTLHCRLDELTGGSVRQIFSAPGLHSFPACIVCVHGSSSVTVVAAWLDTVLTRFQAKEGVRSADYCVPLEILLVLSEEGVVTVVKATVNSVEILDEWDKIENWDWSGGQVGAKVGTACCLVIYSDITDIQRQPKQWKSLAYEPMKVKHSQDSNRFLVILGHRGGCLTVLSLLTSKVLFRIAAHNDQNIITMHAYPDRGYLLTAGEDKTIMVWCVSARFKQCLALHFSVLCDHRPVLLELMGNHLMFTLEDAENDIHIMVQHSLESQWQYTQETNEKHRSKITGLCACRHLSVFASSSEDGTVHIWDMENRLLRVLQLNSVLECLSYCEESGDLLLGIAGNLYRIPHKHLLPTESRTQDWDELSELPKMWSSRLECRASHNAEMLGPENIAENKYPELGALMERHKDLESLLKGEVDCKKKGRHTQQMKVEAFSNYLHLIYREPPKIRDKLVEMASWLNKDGEEGKDDTQTAPIAECKWRRTRPIQPAKKLKHLPPIKRPTPPMAPPPDPMPPSPPPAPCVPNTPPKPTRLPHTPITPSNPPAFLRQFLGEDWFLKIFPDPSCISSSVSPREFCSLLCDFMVSCSMTQKQSVLKALLMLLQQQVLDNEALCNRLHVCLQSCVHKHMSMEQQLFVSELLNLMAQLSPNSSVTIVELLAMLADKDRDLKTLALSVLKMLGVEEAELWLSPEVEFWTTSEQQLKSMRDKASHWLNTWTKKYKEHRKCLRSKTRMSPVEVLKYFCSVQRCKQKTEDDRNDAVLPPSGSFKLEPLQQLKCEACSVSKMKHLHGRLLPPLHYRPMLMGFTHLLLLPMSHVTLSPFPFLLDFQKLRKLSPLKYFSHERSQVEYYK